MSLFSSIKEFFGPSKPNYEPRDKLEVEVGGESLLISMFIVLKEVI
ncbi:MAG: hypothetical protein ACR5K6_00205 [Wolbachia sp.]